MEIAKPKEFKLRKEPQWWIIDENGNQTINPHLIEDFKQIMDGYQPIRPSWDELNGIVDWTYRPGDIIYGTPDNTFTGDNPFLGQPIGISSRQLVTNDYCN